MDGLLSIYVMIGAYFAGLLNGYPPEQEDAFLFLCEAMVGLFLWPVLVALAIYFKIKKLKGA